MYEAVPTCGSSSWLSITNRRIACERDERSFKDVSPTARRSNKFTYSFLYANFRQTRKYANHLKIEVILKQLLDINTKTVLHCLNV